MKDLRLTGIFVFLLLVSGLSFSAFNGRVHLFDWDEINFAESAREMIVTGDYLTVRIGFHPFWEKPPLFMAMQAASMNIFGVNEMAARLPNTIAGLLTLLVLFFTGRKFFGDRFGLAWCILYLVSFLPFLYFKSGLIDPWFNLFIFSGIVTYILYEQDGHSSLWLVLSAILTGLAVLTKGPVALLVVLLTAGTVFILRRFQHVIPLKGMLLWFLVFVITGGTWFLLMALNGRAETIAQFFIYQVRLFRTEDAGHGGFPLFHVVVLFFGAFPASVLALTSFFRNRADEGRQRAFRNWMLVLFWVVLILFSLVKTKIVHYSSLCYFPITFLATLEITWLLENKKRLSRGILAILASVISVWAVFSFLVPLALGPFKPTLIRMLATSDAATLAMLGTGVRWPVYTFVPALLLVLTFLFILIYRRNLARQMAVLATGCFLFINLSVWFFTSRVEEYSQRANIEFFKGLEGKDVYTRTLGIKSYANYFYAKVLPAANPIADSKNWQLFGPVDKPVYCSFSLNQKRNYLKRYYNLDLLDEQNGFVFCVRKPTIQDKP